MDVGSTATHKASSTPVVQWSTREQLVLASAVQRSGDQNWVSVSRAVRPVMESSRPVDFYSQKNCATQYSAMLDTATTPKRKRREDGGPEVVETVEEQIVRNFTEKRIKELDQSLSDAKEEYMKLKHDIEMIERGDYDDKLHEMWQEAQIETSISNNDTKKVLVPDSPRMVSPPSNLIKFQAQAVRVGTEVSKAMTAPPQQPIKTDIDTPQEIVPVPELQPTPAIHNPTSVSVALPSGPLAKSPSPPPPLSPPSPPLPPPPAPPPPSAFVGMKEVHKDHCYSKPEQDQTDEPRITIDQPKGDSDQPQTASVGVKEEESTVMLATSTEESSKLTPCEGEMDIGQMEYEDCQHNGPELPEELPSVTTQEVKQEEITVAEDYAREESAPLVESTPQKEEKVEKEAEQVDKINEPVEQPSKEDKKEEEEEEEVKMDVELEQPQVGEEQCSVEKECTRACDDLSKNEESVVRETEMKEKMEKEDEGTLKVLVKKEDENCMKKEEVEEMEEEEEVDVEAADPEEVQPVADEVMKRKDSPAPEVPSSKANRTVEQVRLEEEEEETPSRYSRRNTRTSIRKRRSTRAAVLRAEEGEGSMSDPASREVTDQESEEELTSTFSSSAPSPAYSQGEGTPDTNQAHKSWRKTIMLVWTHASQHKFATLFLHPVKEEDAPGYHEIIHRPMDLHTIKRNIETGIIKSDIEFQHALLLMFQNALMYNSSNQYVYKMAEEMRNDVVAQFEDYLQTQMRVSTKTLRSREGRGRMEAGEEVTKRSTEDIFPTKKKRSKLED